MSATTPNIVQSRSQASSAAAPATFTASYAGATTTGNLLVAVVAIAASGAATVSTPTSWTAGISSSLSGSILLSVFYWPNSTSLTNVVFTTLTNTNGIVVLLWEISGMNLTQPLDPNISSVNTSAGTTVPSTNTYTPTIGNEIYIGAIAFNATGSISSLTATPSTGPGAITAATITGTSTTGATNVTANGYVSLPGPVYPASALRIGATLAGSVFAGALVQGFTSQQGGAVLGEAIGSGVAGMLVSAGAGQAVGM